MIQISSKIKNSFSKLFVKYSLIFILSLLIANSISVIITPIFVQNNNPLFKNDPVLVPTDGKNKEEIEKILGSKNPVVTLNDKKNILYDTLTINVIVTMIVGTILTFFFTSSIVKPLKKVIEGSKKVSSGDLSVVIPVTGRDEIADLTINFNTMVSQISKNEYLHKDFVSNVSHEFKTPITSLKGYAMLLKDPNLTLEKRVEYADIVIEESARLSNLSSNMLKLSELENSKSFKDEYYLDEQIRNAVIFLQHLWESKNIEIELNLEEIKIKGSNQLMYQVFINLISNAIDYSNNSTVITISLTQNENIVFSIKDQGIGMSEEDQKNIFLRFYKADKSRNTTGTGLGLSIVQKIVTLHNGTIDVKSVLNKGSEFIITLPKYN